MPTPQNLHLSLAPTRFIQLLSLQQDKCAVPPLQMPVQYGSNSLISLWVSCWRSSLLLEWFHVSPVWSVQDTQDPAWLLVPHVTALRLLQVCWLLTFVGVSHTRNFLFLVVDCFGGVLWANSIEQWKPQRQGQAQFQVLETVVLSTGKAGGSGWAIQVGTVGQPSAFSSTGCVTTGWWRPAQAHTSSLGWEGCVFLSVHLWWVQQRLLSLILNTRQYSSHEYPVPECCLNHASVK